MSEAKNNAESEGHLHRCQKCGTVWGHGDMMAADIEAHACPNCGEMQWRKYRGLHVAQRGSPAGHTYTYADYFRAVLPIALLATALVLSVLWLSGWFDERI